MILALELCLPKATRGRIFTRTSKLYFPEKGCHLGTNRSDNET